MLLNNFYQSVSNFNVNYLMKKISIVVKIVTTFLILQTLIIIIKTNA